MVTIFQEVSHQMWPTKEILAVIPFKKIWERDNSADKDVALQEMAYIYYMTAMDDKNPFREYPTETKSDAIAKYSIAIPNWQPCSNVQDAIDFIEENKIEGSRAYAFYQAALIACEKQRIFLTRVNPEERHPTTMKPIYKADEIPKAIMLTEGMFEKLRSFQKKMNTEFTEASKVRGQKTVSPFANPESLLK